jgi:hypothetical protein
MARNAPLQMCCCIWDNLFFGIPLPYRKEPNNHVDGVGLREVETQLTPLRLICAMMLNASS